MSVEGTVKRIKANKPVSSEAWYEYCISKGYDNHCNPKQLCISALKVMKDTIKDSKDQARFLLYADRITHDYVLACNTNSIRNYIRVIIGDVEVPSKMGMYEGYDKYFANIKDACYIHDNVEYLIENKFKLLMQERISGAFYNWLKLFEVKYNLDMMRCGRKPVDSVYLSVGGYMLESYDFKPWAEYAYERRVRNNRTVDTVTKMQKWRG